MDANKDDAYKCLSLAKTLLNSGNKADALKYLKKAKRIYPLIDDSLNKEEKKKSNSPVNENKNNSTYTARRRSQSNSRANAETKNYSKEQLHAVKKIIDCKDLYDVLGVNKSCSDSDLKKAYRALALKFHPDKNQAPRASEAFKKIGKAFDTLSDKEKRKRYDDTGTTDETVSTTYHRTSSAHYQEFQGFDSDVFNIFFNSGFPFGQFAGGTGTAGGNHYRSHHTRGHRTHTESRESDRSNNYFVYIQLLPLLLLFGLSFFSSLMVKDQAFSFQKTNKYPIERFTVQHNIPYFVKANFKSEHGSSLSYIESQIEEEYQTNLRFRCYREKEYKENVLYRARYYGSDEDYNKALRISVPSCDRLLEVFGG